MLSTVFWNKVHQPRLETENRDELYVFSKLADNIDVARYRHRKNIEVQFILK